MAVTASAAQTVAPDHAWRAWASVPDSVAVSDTLTLSRALSLVRRANPLLRSLAYRTDSARFLIDQAGAYPNPGVFFEAENVGGDYSGFDRSELSLRIEQEIELGGKRSKRVDVAKSTWDEAARDAETRAFDLLLETRLRYADVLQADEQLRLAEAADTVVAALAESAENRVRAGATLMADASIAAAARVRARTDIDDAIANRTRARVALSTLWGDTDGFEESVGIGELPLPRGDIPPDSAISWAMASPAVRQLELAIATLRAEANLQRGLRTPNIILGGGGRRIEDDDAYTFLVDLALPLPLWDRREGAVGAADAQVRASELSRMRMQHEVSALIAARISTLARARSRLLRTETELIPTLATALDNMRAAYAIGRTSYADLLEVTRTLIELRHDANSTRRTIIEEQVEIERLSGRTIEELMTHE